jgi:hypothetical protein
MTFTFDETGVVAREIDRVLVASTAHMTYVDSLALRTECERNPFVVHSYEEGDFVILNDIEEKMSEIMTSFSSAFVDLILLAQKHDCHILRLDRDGPVYPDLKQFDW